jgi:tRNA-splicing ligase RtcB (3'-phosphate/5'-hydroxy nucleic acid ligase)
MLEYKGKYGIAKVMLETFENDGEKTVQQIYEFLNHPAFTNPISIMPDCHVGKGAVIGFTMKLTDKVIPNVIGVDIGCGMLSCNFEKLLLDHVASLEELDQRIREKIPFSTSVNEKFEDIPNPFYMIANKKLKDFQTTFNNEFKTDYTIPVIDEEWIKNKCKEIDMDYERTVKSLGTLGGGNHFIEVGIGNDDNFWITIHSGSRQFGLKIATYHQKKAGKGVLTYLEGQDMFNYLVDMNIAQIYADFNRIFMLNRITWITDIFPFERISSVHNYIDFNDFIIRKGAIASYENSKMIIPFNMEDGILICEGKSNEEWNYSAPHGAGRVDSRRWAKENLSLDEAKHRMEEKGIYSSKIPIDETKLAYKDPKIIEDAIEPTATIINRLKPILSCKGD